MAGLLVVSVIIMLGAMPAVATLLLFSESLLAFRLSRSGVVTEGVCVAHKQYSDKGGMGVLVEYAHPVSGRTTFEIRPFTGVLPIPGVKVKVCFVERNPQAALLSPLPRRPAYTEDEVERFIAARVARKSVFERNPAPELSFVLEEWTLRRPLGGRALVHRQLEHLLHMGQSRRLGRIS